MENNNDTNKKKIGGGVTFSITFQGINGTVAITTKAHSSHQKPHTQMQRHLFKRGNAPPVSQSDR